MDYGSGAKITPADRLGHVATRLHDAFERKMAAEKEVADARLAFEEAEKIYHEARCQVENACGVGQFANVRSSQLGVEIADPTHQSSVRFQRHAD